MASRHAYSYVQWLPAERSLLRTVFDFVRREEPVAIARIAGAATPKEETIGLLNAAAEIEHALLVQYLYAYFSLADPNEPAAQSLLQIAQQEMGHFITVQNLLLLLGAPIHCDRDALLPGSEFEPLAFTLEPLSLTSAGKYVLIEAPAEEHLPDDLRKVVQQIMADLGDAAMHLRRVGEIYSMIYWLFQPDDTPTGAVALPAHRFPPGWHLANADLVPSANLAPFLADPIEWRTGTGVAIHVEGTIDRATALPAIAAIAQQGEGTAPQQDSHFELFLTIYAAMQASPPTILPVPSHANTFSSPSDNPAIEGGRITHAVARLWALLIDSRYNMLLISIALSLGASRDDAKEAALRRKCCDWAFQEMIQGVARGARILTELPLRDGGVKVAAVPFELQPLAGDRAGLLADLRALLGASDSLIADLLQNSSPTAVQKLRLQGLKKINDERRAFLDAWN
jgi:hypothetical protein